MKEAFLWITGVLIGIFLLSLYFFGLDTFFRPKEEALRYRTFKQSQSYNEGMVRRLNDLKLQYESSTNPVQKQTLKAVVIHEFSVYPESSMPDYLQSFYASLRGGN